MFGIVSKKGIIPKPVFGDYTPLFQVSVKRFKVIYNEDLKNLKIRFCT